jgi:hypothetical protein
MRRRQKKDTYSVLNNYGKGFEFIGPSYDDGWSIYNLDPVKLKRIERFLIETDRKLGGVLPRKIVMADENEPRDIGVLPDRLMMDITSLDYWGEKVFKGVLAHESAHVKCGDPDKIINPLSEMTLCLNGVNHIKDVYEENPASCCGLILKTFGTFDAFETHMGKALAHTHDVRRFFSDIGISSDTDPAKLADDLIGGNKQSQLDRLCELFPEGSSASNQTARFYANFWHETIDERKFLANAGIQDFIDYNAYLPKDSEDRKRLVERLSRYYRQTVHPAYSTFEELERIGRVIHHATEHRADHEALLKCGPEVAHAMTRFLQKEYHREAAQLPEEERGEFWQTVTDQHPHPDDRVKFIETHAHASHKSRAEIHAEALPPRSSQKHARPASSALHFRPGA